MTHNEIDILHRHPDQVLDAEAVEDLIAAGRAEGIEPDRLRAFRGLATVARLDLGRPASAGELIGHLEASNAGERLDLVERGRALAGLDAIHSIRFQELQRALSAVPGRDERGRAIQQCAAAGCEATPSNHLGAPLPVVDAKWWCANHKQLAGPDDHLPPDDLDPRLNPTTRGQAPVGRRQAAPFSALALTFPSSFQSRGQSRTASETRRVDITRVIER
jgi:hypothetical protein